MLSSSMIQQEHGVDCVSRVPLRGGVRAFLSILKTMGKRQKQLYVDQFSTVRYTVQRIVSRFKSGHLIRQNGLVPATCDRTPTYNCSLDVSSKLVAGSRPLTVLQNIPDSVGNYKGKIPPIPPL